MEVMKEVHAGSCGPHMNGKVLSAKIRRQGYYWDSMDQDCIQLVRKCHDCQIHGDQVHIPPSELHNLTSPWPFSAWGIDIIGPIKPTASNGHKYIIVAVEYFSRYMEAISLPNVTAQNMK